jgi:hypothetical protein
MGGKATGGVRWLSFFPSSRFGFSKRNILKKVHPNYLPWSLLDLRGEIFKTGFIEVQRRCTSKTTTTELVTTPV